MVLEITDPFNFCTTFYIINSIAIKKIKWNKKLYNLEKYLDPLFSTLAAKGAKLPQSKTFKHLFQNHSSTVSAVCFRLGVVLKSDPLVQDFMIMYTLEQVFFKYLSVFICIYSPVSSVSLSLLL